MGRRSRKRRSPDALSTAARSPADERLAARERRSAAPAQRAAAPAQRTGAPAQRAAVPERRAGATRPGPVTPRRRPRLDEAPKAPWSPFPLSELCILIGIVLLVLGFVTHGHRGRVELAGGFALLALSVGELALREHLAGYRSHSTLLAGGGAVVLDAILFFATDIPQPVLLAAGVIVFGVLLRALRTAFMRRTGGLGFRA